MCGAKKYILPEEVKGCLQELFSFFMSVLGLKSGFLGLFDEPSYKYKCVWHQANVVRLGTMFELAVKLVDMSICPHVLCVFILPETDQDLMPTKFEILTLRFLHPHSPLCFYYFRKNPHSPG